MKSVEIIYFAITVILAAVAMIKWKRRHDVVTERVSRGLRGYVAARAVVRLQESETGGKRLIPA